MCERLIIVHTYILCSCLEFPPLKILYPVLVQSLPQNFTENVGHLEQYLTATAIFGIVSSSDADQGNRMIMDCLVKQLTHQEDLLEMCDRLEKIPDAPALTHAIEELRKGMKYQNTKVHNFMWILWL